MQKFIIFETSRSGQFGLDDINQTLEQGWKVVEIRSYQHPNEHNIQVLALIEKDESTLKSNKQKIICLNQGSGSAYDNLNDLLEEGWVINQIQGGGSYDGGCCFVWLEK